MKTLSGFLLITLAGLISFGVVNLNEQSQIYEMRRLETKQGKSIKNWVTKEIKVYSKEDLKKKLNDLEYEVTQNDGTERAGTSPLDKNYEPGIYVDKISGEPLYLSIHKYDSGTGWPSFYDVIKSNVIEKSDHHLIYTRTEVRSKDADSHLGHVFDDGPQDKTGLRYCMNGAALNFIPLNEMEAKGYGEFVKQIKGK